jgi:hypothetical protein
MSAVCSGIRTAQAYVLDLLPVVRNQIGSADDDTESTGLIKQLHDRSIHVSYIGV